MGAERIRDEDNFEKGVKEGVQKGLKEGVEKGLKEGVEKGLKEGVEKGLKEGVEKGLKEGEKRKAIDTAKKMLAKNSDLNFISECTGLTPQEIKNLNP
jgi:flagellar biosynthesis/type III secretory pathway protein FliH